MEEKTIVNMEGEIVAKLYIDEKTGNLDEDSWICPQGWK